MIPAHSASSRRDGLLLFVAILLFFSFGLGDRPFVTPSEARYIEIPRQMLATGDWLTPRINGVPYFEKPPLFYWMQAVSLRLFGLNEWAGRLPTALLTALTCLVTYGLGRMLYGRMAGVLAAVVLATSLMGYGLSRAAMLDVPVGFFITACIGAFLAAHHHSNPMAKRNFYLLMYVAATLAMLTKGLIGIVLPGLVIGAWILLTRQWFVLKEARLFTGLILFLLIAAPWHMLTARAHPDFLQFYFIHEHFTRYVSNEHNRKAPWWFFIVITLAGLIPWTGVLPTTMIRSWKEAAPSLLRRSQHNATSETAVFLLLWILLPLIFFSASHSKLLSYIFPIFPPLALLLGHRLALLRHQPLTTSLRLNAIAMILLASAGIAALPLLSHLSGKIAQRVAIASTLTLPMLLPLLAGVAFLAFTLLARRSALHHILALTVFGIALGINANMLGGKLDASTIKPLTNTLLRQLQPGDSVVAYGSYWQDLPVYLNRNITVTGWQGELQFGIEHYPDTQAWMISSDAFWQRCAESSHHVYVFLRQPMFASLPVREDCRLHIIASSGNTLLLEKL